MTITPANTLPGFPRPCFPNPGRVRVGRGRWTGGSVIPARRVGRGMAPGARGVRLAHHHLRAEHAHVVAPGPARAGAVEQVAVDVRHPRRARPVDHQLVVPEEIELARRRQHHRSARRVVGRRPDPDRRPMAAPVHLEQTVVADVHRRRRVERALKRRASVVGPVW